MRGKYLIDPFLVSSGWFELLIMYVLTCVSGFSVNLSLPQIHCHNIAVDQYM